MSSPVLAMPRAKSTKPLPFECISYSLSWYSLPTAQQGFRSGTQFAEVHRLLQVEVKAGLFSASPDLLAWQGAEENNSGVEDSVNALA